MKRYQIILNCKTVADRNSLASAIRMYHYYRNRYPYPTNDMCLYDNETLDFIEEPTDELLYV